ncbi:MAG TPA: hypothetical protein VNN79_09055 [Actinomycetota bacterium]|nr:hypothetical protein [Actinomycetota bacterium]
MTRRIAATAIAVLMLGVATAVPAQASTFTGGPVTTTTFTPNARAVLRCTAHVHNTGPWSYGTAYHMCRNLYGNPR